MKNLFIYTAIFIAFFQACRSGGKTTAEIPAGFKTDKIVANASQLEQLVTKAEIAEIIAVDADKIKIYKKNYANDIAVNTLLFTWENGAEQTVKMANGEQKLLGSSSIGIGRLMKLSKAEFEAQYQVKTKAEVNAEIDKIVQNKAIDADIAIWEAKEIARRAKTQAFERLENVGSSAYWETPLNVLHVLADDVAFSVTTNLSDDPEVGKQKAIALADLIFRKSTF